MSKAAAISKYGFDRPTAWRTSVQLSFRPNHHNSAAASRQSPANSRYLRYFCWLKFPERSARLKIKT